MVPAIATLVVLDELQSQRGGRDTGMSATGGEDVEVEQPRRRLRRRLILLAVVVLVVAAATAVRASRSEPSSHRLIYSQTVPDGRVFQCFSDGAFIGSAGSEAEGRKAPEGSDGSEAGPALVVRPPDYTEEEARRAMEEYRKSGRTPEEDLAEFDRLSAECRRRR